MVDADIKTGQHIDAFKELVTIPSLAFMMHRAFPLPVRPLDMMELGCGDCTSFQKLLMELHAYKLSVGRLVAVDNDPSVFPSIIKTMYIDHPDDFAKMSVMLTVAGTSMGFVPDPMNNVVPFDVVNTQLVLHQMSSQAELSLALLRANTVLTSQNSNNPAHLFVTDLDPLFLDYLAEQEPGKIQVDPDRREAPGSYCFDSGGDAPVVRREIAQVIAEAICAGFDLKQAVKPLLKPVLGLKERYRRMDEKGIPLVYQLDLQANPDRVLSHTEGKVKWIKPAQRENRMEIKFHNGDSYFTPKPAKMPVVLDGDRIIISEIILPDQQRVVNMWGVPKDPDRDLWLRNWHVSVNSQGK